MKTLRDAQPARVLIIDRFVSPATDKNAEKTSQRITTAFDIAMAALHGGKTRTMSEWQSLVTDAGLALHSVSNLRASMGQAVFEIRQR
jgi:hypothetical protein